MLYAVTLAALGAPAPGTKTFLNEIATKRRLDHDDDDYADGGDDDDDDDVGLATITCTKNVCGCVCTVTSKPFPPPLQCLFTQVSCL